MNGVSRHLTKELVWPLCFVSRQVKIACNKYFITMFELECHFIVIVSEIYNGRALLKIPRELVACMQFRENHLEIKETNGSPLTTESIVVACLSRFTGAFVS